MTVMVEDPFGQTLDEMDDPFATSEDVKPSGGSFTPAPKPADLNGRLVVMIPRKFRSDAPKKAEYIGTGKPIQELFTVDLYVLDRQDLTYVGDLKVEGSDEKVATEITISADEMPKGWTGVWVPQGALIGQLRNVDGKKILMGVMRRGPQAADRGKKTFESINAEFEQRRQDLIAEKKVKEIKFSWQIDTNVSPEQAQVARDWWISARGEIDPITHSEDVTGQK